VFPIPVILRGVSPERILEDLIRVDLKRAKEILETLKKSGVQTLEVYDRGRLEAFLSDNFSDQDEIKGATLEFLRQRVHACQRCALSEGRTQTVFGSGPKQADLMFIGEAPGFEEDRQGEPFVGRAGQLLTRMIKAMGFDRKEVYIANCVKCRPPNNRDPFPDELDSCRPYLDAQIEQVNPRVICCLGRVASQAVLKCKDPISRLRGRFFTLGQRVVMCTFHPAYLLRNEEGKRPAWEDLKKVRDRVRGIDSSS
jgi:uracil-DNA glycosylase